MKASFKKHILPLLTVLALWGVFEAVVRVEPAWGQAVGYCGYGRPCTVTKLTIPSRGAVDFTAINLPEGGRICFNASCSNYMMDYATNAPYIGGTWNFDNVITSQVATGNNAFAVAQNGARYDIGTGANDYFVSDGTYISTANFNVTSAFALTGEESIQNVIGTSGSGTGITVVANGYVRHFVDSITIAENALTAAAGTQDITVWTVPAKTRLLRVVANGTVAFDDGAGGISATTIQCGTSGTTNAYLANGSIFTAPVVLGDVVAEIGANLVAATWADIPSMTSTTAIVCRFATTGGNVVALTTGSVTITIEGVVYP